MIFNGGFMRDDKFDAVRIGNQYTFKNIKTGKLLERKFDYVQIVENGWSCVLINGKWTFYNPYTDKFCKQSFVRTTRVDDDGWAAVKINEKDTLFNPNTEIFCNQKFDYVFTGVIDGLRLVKIDGLWTFFNPNDNYLFHERFDGFKFFSLPNALKNYPEDFLHLPTALFRDKDRIKNCLDAIKLGVMGRYSEADIKKFNTLQTQLREKIKTEENNIRLEDEAKEKGIETSTTEKQEAIDIIRGIDEIEEEF